MTARTGRLFVFFLAIAIFLLVALALFLYLGQSRPMDGQPSGNNTGPINDTGIMTGENAIGMVSADTAQSKAMTYWTLNHASYPEASFSVTNVTSKNGDWLVEIGMYDKIYAANGTPQYTYKGVVGKILVSKATGEVREG